MVAKVVDGNVDVRCNGCGKVAPPAAEIMAAHGLNHMGWHCYGGTHYCETCKEKRDDAAA